jgi:hypothetical protein
MLTVFYVHFSIFKLKLDLQYRYARAQLTVKGRGGGAECRNSSHKVGVTSLKIRAYSETALEGNTFLRRNELNYQKVWPTLLESFVTNLLTFERDNVVRGSTVFTSNAGRHSSAVALQWCPETLTIKSLVLMSLLWARHSLKYTRTPLSVLWRERDRCL